MNNNVIRNMNNKNPQCRTWERSSLVKMSKENTPYVPQVLCFFLSAFALLGSPQTCPSSKTSFLSPFFPIPLFLLSSSASHPRLHCYTSHLAAQSSPFPGWSEKKKS